MPVNPNLLAQFAQPVKSVGSFLADYANQDAAQQALQHNALLMQSQQATMQEKARALREAQTRQQQQDSVLAAAQASGKIDPFAAVRARLDPKLIEFLANSHNLGRPEVKRTIEGRDASGNPVTFREDAYGRRIGDAIPKAVELATVDLGDKVQPVNRYQLRPDAPLVKGRSPENVASVNAMLDNAAATRAAATTNAGAVREAAAMKRDQDTEMKLADDYRAQSKMFGEATSAYKQIGAALKTATESPSATLAAATKFMKIIDPGSVVRESELGMALAATGALDRIGNYMNTLRLGKVLTAKQAKDFEATSQAIYGAAQEVQRRIDTDYTAKANAYKLRPEMVIQNLGQNDGVMPADVAAALKKHGG